MLIFNAILTDSYSLIDIFTSLAGRVFNPSIHGFPISLFCCAEIGSSRLFLISSLWPLGPLYHVLTQSCSLLMTQNSELDPTFHQRILQVLGQKDGENREKD